MVNIREKYGKKKKQTTKWYLGPDELKITNLNGFSLSTFSPATPCPEVLAVKITIRSLKS